MKYYDIIELKGDIFLNSLLLNDEVIFDSIRVYVDHPAKYWSDEFLEVKEAKTDSKNTKAVLHAFEQALKPVKNVSLGDYYYIKNSVVHDLQSDQDINYNDLVEKTIDHYQPLSNEVNLDSVKEKLITAGESNTFDTQFHTDPEAIKTAGKIRIHVSPAIDVTVKEGLSNWRDSFKTYEKSDGRTYIVSAQQSLSKNHEQLWIPAERGYAASNSMKWLESDPLSLSAK